MNSLKRVLLRTMTFAVLAPGAAIAQEAPKPEPQDRVEEIVVTAQRREENLQKVPLSVSALSSNTLVRQVVTDTSTLSRLVPGLVITKSVGSGITYIRGVGQNTGALGVENSVATYLDGVYLAQPSSNLFTLNSIQRVEVLKGPQGTLFGRNATGGVINVVTKDPGNGSLSDIEASYGNYNHIMGHVYLDHRFSDKVSANFSAFLDDELSGYVTNVTLHKKQYQFYNHGAQAKLRIEPDADTNIVANVLYDYSKGYDGTDGGTPPGSINQFGQGYLGKYLVTAGLEAPNTVSQSLEYLRAQHDFSWARVLNIAALHQVHEHIIFDVNALPFGRGISANTEFHDRGNTFTEELQFQSLPKSSLTWIFGLYYLHDKALTSYVGRMDFTPFQTINNEILTNSYSAFAQATKTILPKTRLTLGARYTVDTRDFSGTQLNGAGVLVLDVVKNAAAKGFSANRTWKSPTYRASLDHDFSDNVLGYLSFNRGFKSGVFNPTGISAPAANPETLNAYEAGLKSELFDHKLRFNLAAFYYDYRNVQIRATQPPAVVTLIINAANATIKGLDADFQAVITRRLSINGGLEKLDAKYKDFPSGVCPVVLATGGNGSNKVCDLSGRQMVRAPNFTGNIGYIYDLPIGQNKLSFSGNFSYNSGFPFEATGRLRQPSYSIVNGSVTWTPDKGDWHVRLWVKNVTNSYYFVYMTPSASDVYSPGQPRMYGVSVGKSF